MAANSGQNPVFVGGLVVAVSQWSGDWMAILADNSTSGARGTRYVGVITDCSWQIEIPQDDSAFVEALGLGVGALIPLMYFRHTQTIGDKLEFTTVEKVTRVSNGKDIVRVTVSGKGGALSNNVAVPDPAVFPLPLLGS